MTRVARRNEPPKRQERADKLIFLPGAGGSARFWQPVSDLLAHPVQRKLLGWPGFGETPADPRVRGIEDLVARVVDELDRPCALIAQSMGGLIALKAAAKRPDHVTHLVLAATSGGVDMADLQAQDWRPAFEAANPSSPRWFSDYREDVSQIVRGLRAPTLLLWGDADSISPLSVAERLRKLLPHSRLHVIPGGGHDFANQLAPLVATYIDEHLALR
jgi:pimeloyl-ACP methyl ester carboxylesterase